MRGTQIQKTVPLVKTPQEHKAYTDKRARGNQASARHRKKHKTEFERLVEVEKLYKTTLIELKEAKNNLERTETELRQKVQKLAQVNAELDLFKRKKTLHSLAIKTI